MKLLNKVNQVSLEVNLEDVIATANYCKGHEVGIPEELFFRRGFWISTDYNDFTVKVPAIPGMEINLNLEKVLKSYIKNMIKLSGVKIDGTDGNPDNVMELELVDLKIIDVDDKDYVNDAEETMTNTIIKFQVTCLDELADFLESLNDSDEEMVKEKEDVHDTNDNMIELLKSMEVPDNVVNLIMGAGLGEQHECGCCHDHDDVEAISEMVLQQVEAENAEEVKAIDDDIAELEKELNKLQESPEEDDSNPDIKELPLATKLFYYRAAESKIPGLKEMMLYILLNNKIEDVNMRYEIADSMLGFVSPHSTAFLGMSRTQEILTDSYDVELIKILPLRQTETLDINELDSQFTTFRINKKSDNYLNISIHEFIKKCDKIEKFLNTNNVIDKENSELLDIVYRTNDEYSISTMEKIVNMCPGFIMRDSWNTNSLTINAILRNITPIYKYTLDDINLINIDLTDMELNVNNIDEVLSIVKVCNIGRANNDNINYAGDIYAIPGTESHINKVVLIEDKIVITESEFLKLIVLDLMKSCDIGDLIYNIKEEALACLRQLTNKTYRNNIKWYLESTDTAEKMREFYQPKLTELILDIESLNMNRYIKTAVSYAEYLFEVSMKDPTNMANFMEFKELIISKKNGGCKIKVLTDVIKDGRMIEHTWLSDMYDIYDPEIQALVGRLGKTQEDLNKKFMNILKELVI